MEDFVGKGHHDDQEADDLSSVGEDSTEEPNQQTTKVVNADRSCIYNFYKSIVNCLSRISQVVMTIGDLFGCLVAVVFVLHFYVLIAMTTTDIGGNPIPICAFLVLFFAPMTSNILLIPLWHFFQFSYFKEVDCPWVSVVEVFSPGKRISVPQRALLAWRTVQSILLVITCVFVALTTFVTNAKAVTIPVDILLTFFVVFIPLAKVVLLYIGYAIHFYRSMWTSNIRRFRKWYAKRSTMSTKPFDPFLLSIYGHNRLFGFHFDKNENKTKFMWFINRDVLQISDDYIDENDAPLDVVESKDFKREIEGLDKVQKNDIVWEILHIVSGLLTLAVLMGTASQSDYGWLGMSLYFVVFLVVIVPLTEIRFPFFGFDLSSSLNWRTPKTRALSADFASIVMKKCGEENKKKDEYTRLRALSIGVHAIVIVLLVAVAGMYILNMTAKTTRGDFDEFREQFTNYVFNGAPPNPTINETKEVVSEVCYVKPYDIKMINIVSLIAATYYDVRKPATKKFLREFFDTRAPGTFDDTECRKCLGEEPEDPTFDCRTNCYDKMNLPKMDRMDFHASNYSGSVTHFVIPRSNLTIIAIRGTACMLDAALDVQFFMSSLLLTVFSPIEWFTSTFTEFTTITIRGIISAPLIIFRKVTLVYRYANTIADYVQSDSVEKLNNIIYVGHSLGGGLAKYMSMMTGRPAISLSGPGTKIFQSVVDTDYPLQRTLSGMTEIIPDCDVVPRVEISAGTKHRIMCNNGPLGCHSSLRSLCMMGIMCQTEHKDFCNAITDLGYDAMKDFAMNA